MLSTLLSTSLICRKSIFNERRLFNSDFTYNQLYLSDIENQIYIPRYNIEQTNNIQRNCNFKTVLLAAITICFVSILITIIAASV